MKTDKTCTYSPAHYFAALKLIEQLYKDGQIPAFMYRNILNEYADVVDLSKFSPPADKEVAA
jgi:hypothetical protein